MMSKAFPGRVYTRSDRPDRWFRVTAVAKSADDPNMEFVVYQEFDKIATRQTWILGKDIFESVFVTDD
jgi:hypothetical protein